MINSSSSEISYVQNIAGYTTPIRPNLNNYSYISQEPNVSKISNENLIVGREDRPPISEKIKEIALKIVDKLRLLYSLDKQAEKIDNESTFFFKFIIFLHIIIIYLEHFLNSII